MVVTYSDDSILFIQVKHTRTDATLTFGDLVSVGDSGGKSLLGELAEAWQQEKSKYQETKICLFTNRRRGERITQISGKESHYKRPPLNLFLKQLRQTNRAFRIPVREKSCR